MRLVVLKPADRSDMAGDTSSVLDRVRIKTLFWSTSSRNLLPNANAKGSGMPKAKEERRRHNPFVFEYVHLMTKLLLGAIQEASCGSKVHCPLPPKKPSFVTHFDERGTPPAPQGHHGLFDYGKLSQAHVLKLGRSRTGLIALALSPFVRECTATDIPELYCFCARTPSPPSPPPPLLSQLSMGSPHAAPGRHASTPSSYDADGAARCGRAAG
ncbi:hypothetical protein EDB86DRAFT_3076354 [Lactarius hatsudake]|nr:hypothetical protein EDB86DRAFT_3076354 [Lactarius hatsudake]